MNNITIQLVKDPLYNKGVEGYLNIAENTDFPITFSVSEIRDITKRKGAFSKTIKLAGDKNNNKLLNNYFDVNVVDGTFNINTLQKCIVLENNIPILENAYIQLISVRKVQTTNRHDQLVEYEVIVKDDVADFFTKLGNAELTDIKFDGFNHLFTAANVVSTFNNTVSDVYKYVMPQAVGTNYNLEEWLPGIYAKQYWDKIFANAGYQYEWTSLTNSDIQFDKLIIPYNGDAPKLSSTQLDNYKIIADLDVASQPFIISQAPAIGTIGSFYDGQLILDNEIQDNNGDYDPVLGEYTSFFQTTGTNITNLQIDISYVVNLDNTSAGTAYLQDNGDIAIGYARYTPILYVYKNGVLLTQSNMKVTGNPWIQKSQGTSIPVGVTPIHTETCTLNIPLSTLQIGDIITTKVGLNINQAMAGSTVYWRDAITGTGNVRVHSSLEVNTCSMIIQPSINQFGYNADVDLNQFVPLKVKQTDFIKAFVQMYNLIIDVDKTQPNKLLIRTRDEFYDAGVITDWTKKINKQKDQLLQFLPELSSKKIKLTYKQDEDVLNKGYKNNVNEIYAQQEFTFDNEYIKGEDVKEILFSPTPIVKSDFNAVTPSINGTAPKCNIRILYAGDIFNCNNYKIIDYVIGSTEYGELSLTTYPLFSHFDHPTNPSFDINFGINDYYFYGDVNATELQLTNNNLYNLHWRRTLNQINSNKILTGYFDLNGNDIHKLKLNDKIRIDNSYWNINKIIDYNPSKPGPTKVELLSIDEELKLAPFKTKIPRLPVGKGDAIGRPIWIKEKEILSTNNVITSPYVNVLGKNNIVGDQTKGQIIGDNNNVFTDNVTISGDNNTVKSNSVIVGNDNTVAENLENVQIFGSEINATESNTLYANNIEVTTINNVPATSITTGLPGVLNIDNTTGGNDIVVSSGDSIKSESGQALLIYSDNYFESKVSDLSANVQDEIMLDPQGLGNGTGIKSQNTLTGEYSNTQYGPNYITNYITDGTLQTSQINMFLNKVILYSSTGYTVSTSHLDVEPTIITIDSPNINIPTLPVGTPVNNVGIDAGGNLVVGTGGGPDTNFANTDLTFTADRFHDADGFQLNIENTPHFHISSPTGLACRMIIDALNAVDPKILSFRTNNSQRFAIRVDSANDDIAFRCYDNTGTFTIAPIKIERATGQVEISEAFKLPLVDGTANQVLKTDGAGNTSWTTVSAPLETIATVTGTGAITNDITLVNNSASITVTLPTAVGIAGKKYTIKAKNNTTASNNITIATTASQTIDTVTTYVMRIPFESVTVVSDGTAWFII